MDYTWIVMNPVDQTGETIHELNIFLTSLSTVGPYAVLAFIIIAVIFAIIMLRFWEYRLNAKLAVRDTARAQAEEEQRKRDDNLLNKALELSAGYNAGLSALTRSVDALSKVAEELSNAHTNTHAMLEMIGGNVQTIVTTGSPGLQAVAQEVSNIGMELKLVKVSLQEANTRLDSVERKLDRFPSIAEFASDLEELKRLARECADKTKKITDENPIALLPGPIHDAEDASALTPGAAAA